MIQQKLNEAYLFRIFHSPLLSFSYYLMEFKNKRKSN